MDSIPQIYVQSTFEFGVEPRENVALKHCPGCGNDHPETDEYWHRKGGKAPGFRVPCKTCRHDQYLPHRAEIVQQHREAFLAKSPEEQEEIRKRQNKQYRDRSVKQRKKGMCSKCLYRLATIGKMCEQCHTEQKRYGDELRDQVLATYGGKCVQCSEAHPAFLSVDHIDNDGADHRRLVGGGGHRLYQWLRKNSFPHEGFQLLCANCNWLKHVSRQPEEKTHMMIWYAQLRQETMRAYGGKCVCCGENRQEVLTIDHVNDDGAEHRRQVGAGSYFYSWLRKQGFPQDGRFQALCFNCNRARFYQGVCPHQQ